MPRRLGKVEYYGPFFERDPKQTLRQNMKRATAEMVAAGEQMTRAALAPGQGSRLQETITSKIHEARAGGGSLFGVIYSTMSTEQRDRSWVTWLERGRRRQRGGGPTVQSARFKGYRPFARVRAALKRQAKLTAEELSKGLA